MRHARTSEVRIRENGEETGSILDGGEQAALVRGRLSLVQGLTDEVVRPNSSWKRQGSIGEIPKSHYVLLASQGQQHTML